MILKIIKFLSLVNQTNERWSRLKPVVFVRKVEKLKTIVEIPCSMEVRSVPLPIQGNPSEKKNEKSDFVINGCIAFVSIHTVLYVSPYCITSSPVGKTDSAVYPRQSSDTNPMSISNNIGENQDKEVENSRSTAMTFNSYDHSTMSGKYKWEPPHDKAR